MTAAVLMDGSKQHVNVRFTRHAVQRYIERVRPALDESLASRELGNLAGAGTITTTTPAWRGSTGGMVLDLGDVCFVLDVDRRDLEQLVACTCLTRTSRIKRRDRKPQLGRTR